MRHSVDLGEPALDDFTYAYDPELEAAIQHDTDLIAEWFGTDGDDGDLEFDGTYDWLDRPDFPRYQVMVELREPPAPDNPNERATDGWQAKKAG